MTYENPPIENNGEETEVLEAVETYKDPRELPYDATAQQKIKDIMERSAEKPGGPTDDELEQINALKESISATPKIEEIAQQRSTTVEEFKDERTSDQKQDFVENRFPTKGEGINKIKKFFMTLGLVGAMGSAAAKDNSVEKTPEDSLKNKIEVGVSTKSVEQVNNKLRNDWNEYVDWLESKGMKGAAELDKGGKGFAMIEEYRKANPATSVSKETIDRIQAEFSKYRQWVLNEIREGRAQLTPGVTEENFMKALSIIDGIPGQRTTSFKFPKEYLVTISTNKVNGVITDSKVETQNKGFAKTVSFNDIAKGNK